jgi:hypothetical protein
MVIFSVALSDYDQLGAPASGSSRTLVNKMIQSRDLFEATIRCKSLSILSMSFICVYIAETQFQWT